MTYSTTKFEVATSNGLGGDTFTRNVTDGRTHRRTYGRRTDFDTKLIYPFFLKKKVGITRTYIKALMNLNVGQIPSLTAELAALEHLKNIVSPGFLCNFIQIILNLQITRIGIIS